MSSAWGDPHALGADPDKLDEAAAQFGQFEDVLRKWAVRLNGLVHTAPWRGGEADAFRRDWDSRYYAILDRCVVALGKAKVELQQNADQQRLASGLITEATYRSDLARSATQLAAVTGLAVATTTHRSFWDRAKGAFDSGVHRVEHGVSEGLHATEHAVEDVGQFEHEVISSKAFGEVINISHAVANYAAVLSFVPGVGPAFLTIALAAQSVATVGDVLEMADGDRPWSAGALAGDALSLGTDFVGAGAVSDVKNAFHMTDEAADAAARARGVDNIERAFPQVSAKSADIAYSAIHVTDMAHHALSDAAQAVDTTRHVVVDVKSGDPIAMVRDVASYGAVATGGAASGGFDAVVTQTDLVGAAPEGLQAESDVLAGE